ncbi:CopG family ribbon-helix-helix protein [Novosphingobium sp.]|uniref:CopG family ribbon-helix-helix protein n=1 Tax=Novosphingobium sp. TaxID=1874826 RepID=UPI003B51F1F4
MSANPSSTTLSVSVPTDLTEKLDRLSAGTQRSRSYLTAKALSAYVERELEIIEGIQRGLADVAAGRTTPHDVVMARARAIIAEVRETKNAGR